MDPLGERQLGCQKCGHHLVKYPETQSHVLDRIFPRQIVAGVFRMYCRKHASDMLMDLFKQRMQAQDLRVMEMLSVGSTLNYTSIVFGWDTYIRSDEKTLESNIR